MKSKYIRAICLGAAGLLVISTAAINNHKQSEDVTARAAATSSVIEESAETVDAGVTAGIASVTAQALASDEDVAAVSDTDIELTAAAQEEVTSVYGYTNLGIAVVDSGNLNVREAPGTVLQIRLMQIILQVSTRICPSHFITMQRRNAPHQDLLSKWYPRLQVLPQV